MGLHKMYMNLHKTYMKIRDNHMLVMVLCCVIPVVGLFLAVKLFGLGQRWLFWGFLVLCPLMHLLMMRHHGKEGECHGHPKEEAQKTPASELQATKEKPHDNGRAKTIGMALLFLAFTGIMLWVMHPEWR